MENLTSIENSSVLLTNPSPAGTAYSGKIYLCKHP